MKRLLFGVYVIAVVLGSAAVAGATVRHYTDRTSAASHHRTSCRADPADAGSLCG